MTTETFLPEDFHNAGKTWDVVCAYCTWTKDYNKEDEQINSNNLKELIRLYESVFREALRRCAEPVTRGDGWKPIETCPKEDGSVVDLWCRGDFGYTRMPSCIKSGNYWIYVLGGKQEIIGFYDITHWRPIPPPPAKDNDHDNIR